MRCCLKAIGSIVVVYIVAQVLIAIFFPAGGGAITVFTNVLLVVALLAAVVFLLLGGKRPSAQSKTWRIISFIALMSVSFFIIFAYFGANPDIAYRFIENVVPFGGVIGVIVRIVVKLPATNTDFFWSGWGTVSYLIENIFKLLLSAILYPIITKGFLIPFFADNDNNARLFSDRLRRVIVSLFGAVITSLASMFIISEFGSFLSTFGMIGTVINSVYQAVGLVGLGLIAVLTPIITHKINLVVNVFKMLVINFMCVFIVIMAQYQEHFGSLLMAVLVCIAICVSIDVFFKQKEPDWPVRK